MTQPDASYTPIDVGFDLRLHPDTALVLPQGTHIRVRYMEGSKEREVEGGQQTVAEALRKAGYRVKVWRHG